MRFGTILRIIKPFRNPRKQKGIVSATGATLCNLIAILPRFAFGQLRTGSFPVEPSETLGMTK